jgi:hypothetical protein
MPDVNMNTFQSGIKGYHDNQFIRNYSLFLGSVDTTNAALQQYDPLKNGRGRIFFIQMPKFMEALFPDRTKIMRHMLEYGFTKVDGIGDLSLETETMTGGYVGKQIALPSLAKDDTNQITVGLYEFAGSPIREYIDMWISGISDKETGYSTYHGLCDPRRAAELGVSPMKYAQYNHTAEAIYVTTDPTGLGDGIEYACLLTNMFPTQSNRSHFNYNSGESNLVQIDVPFSCSKYESAQINALAKKLVNKYQTLKSSVDLNFKYKQSGPTSFSTYDELIDTRAQQYISAWSDSKDIVQPNPIPDDPI